MIFLICASLYVVVWLSLAPRAARRVADWQPKPYCHGRTRFTYRTSCSAFDGPHCWRTDPVTKTEVSVQDACLGVAAAGLWPLLLGFLPIWLTQRVANRKPSRGMLERRITALEADKAKWEREH
jgi:hypothetical protein